MSATSRSRRRRVGGARRARRPTGNPPGPRESDSNRALRFSDDTTPPCKSIRTSGVDSVARRRGRMRDFRIVRPTSAPPISRVRAASEGAPRSCSLGRRALARLYHVSPQRRSICTRGASSGNRRSVLQVRLDRAPFKPDLMWAPERLMRFPARDAGKVMAYTGSGSVDDETVSLMRSAFIEVEQRGSLSTTVHDFTARVHELLRSARSRRGCPPVFKTLGAILVDRLRSAVRSHALDSERLCFVGGSALNIKWNSASGTRCLFERVWVPPFPNDSGTAFPGPACAELMSQEGSSHRLVRVLGPRTQSRGKTQVGWGPSHARLDSSPLLIHTSGRPVVVLNRRGRLDPGPRARASSHRRFRDDESRTSTPSRSAKATTSRADLLARRAAEVLIRRAGPVHAVRPSSATELDRAIPAVVHVDGTARLQTSIGLPMRVNDVLEAFEAVFRTPVLCNTSANSPDAGFFRTSGPPPRGRQITSGLPGSLLRRSNALSALGVGDTSPRADCKDRIGWSS